MKLWRAEVDVRQGRHIGLVYLIGLGERQNFGFIDVGAIEEARIAVIVVKDDFQQQQIGVAFVAGKFEEQAVFIVQLGAIVAGIAHFFYLGCCEVVVSEIFDYFSKAFFDFGIVQIAVVQYIHGRKINCLTDVNIRNTAECENPYRTYS